MKNNCAKKVLTITLAASLILIPNSLAFAESSNELSPAMTSSDEFSIPEHIGVLCDVTFMSSQATFNSNTFATPNGKSTNINVYFKNDGEAECTVTLYKANNTKVNSFKVEAGGEDYKEMTGAASTTYYIIVTNKTGHAVEGYLRARQLE